MTQHLDGTTDGTFRHYEHALAQIAAGRLDNGRALGGATAMEIARNCLFAVGVSWTGGVPCSFSSNPQRDGHVITQPTPNGETA